MGTGRHRQICCVSTGTGFHGCDSMKNGCAVSELLRYGIMFSKLLSPPCLLLADKDSPPGFQHGLACHQHGISREKQAQLGERLTASQCWQNSLQTFSRALLRSVSQTVNKRPHFQQTSPVPFPWKLAECQVRPGRCDCGSGGHSCQITSAASAQRCFSCLPEECLPVPLSSLLPPDFLAGSHPLV